jgi:hypothetical protein
MQYSKLSDQEIFQALSDSHEVIASIRDYQSTLASRKGFPSNDVARNELMNSNAKLIDAIQADIRVLESELAGRKNKIKPRKIE